MSTAANPQSPKHGPLALAVVIGLFLLGLVGLLIFNRNEANAPAQGEPAGQSVAADQSTTDPEESEPTAPADEPKEPEYLNVVGTVPLSGDLLKSRITIFFSEDIATEGLDRPDAPAPFTIEPSFNGTFTVGRNYLDIHSDAFSPTEPVHVTLSEDIKSVTGKPINPEQRTLSFAPFTFEVRRMWQLEQTAEREAVGVLFPTDVEVAAVQQNTTITDADGSPVSFSVEAGTQPEIARIVLPTGIKLPVSITIGTGLTDATGRFQLASEFITSYPTFTDLHLRSIGWAENYGESQGIRLEFSKAIDPEDLNEFLTIRQENGQTVDFSLESDQQMRHPVVLVTLPDAANNTLTLELEAGLEGVEHSTLRESVTKQLLPRSEMVQGDLLVEDQYWDWADRDGLALSLGFNLPINVPSLKEHLRIEPKIENVRVEMGYNARRVKIFGDWNSGEQYELTLTKGMTLGSAGKLDKEFSYTVTADNVPRYIGFGQDGKYYFPRRNGLGLPLETRNASKVKLRLFRMFPSNIAVAVSDMEGGKPWKQFLDSWSEYLSESTVDVEGTPDRLTATPLALDTTIPDGKRGVFCLAAYDRTPDGGDDENYAGEEGDHEGEDAGAVEDSSEDDPSYEQEYPTATKIVLFTNIGALAHWLDDELVLFAHDLYTLEPKAAATVSVWSKKNQLLGTGTTDERGIAKMGPFETRLGLPRVVVIEAGDDYTFLELEPRNDDTREISPDMPKYDRAAYDAFLYADRELYRPGETVYLRWLVRSNYGDALANVPLTYSVIKPNGQELASGPTTLSAAGGGGLDLATQKDYATGKYVVQLTVPGSKRALGSYAFNLEEFVPNTMKATVTIEQAYWLSGTDYTIAFNAQHLFGAPAADRTAEAKIVLKPAAYRPEKWKTYTFGNDTAHKTEVISTGEVQTDAEGNATFPFSYTAPPTITYPLTALVIGRVFELGGRAVGDTKEVTLFPSPIALGLSLSGADTGKGVTVSVAAITPEETPADLASVKVTIEKQVWNYYVRRFYNYHESNWSESFEPMQTVDVPLSNGTGTTTFTVSDYGYYRVRVHSDKTPQFSTQSFYSYGGTPQLVDSARPSLIKLTLDKPKYVVGEQAVVRIEAPFDGKGFVVLQGEELQQVQSVDIANGVGTATFTLDRAQYPNVWVEATIVHAIKQGQDQVYPFSSFALASIPVEDPARSIAVALPEIPAEIRPETDVNFVVETKDGSGNPVQAEVTLAAVDEGIHAITGYESPDPLRYLARPRRPDYRRAHYYDKVAYDFEKTQIGGDLDALMAKRAAAVDENWIRPVSLWSGVVQTDASGRAVVAMKVPEYSGQLRVVAVAATPAATGAHTAFVYVRRPYTLRTSMPRFLLPGDKATCRATLHNNTDAPAKVLVSWTIEGALEPATGSQDAVVPARGEASVLVDFAAAQAIGQGAIQWYASFRDDAGTDLEKLDQYAKLPVRAPAVFQSHHELHVLKPSESVSVKNTVFLDDARTEVEVLVSANPVLRIYDALRHVVGYPYGCVEQTTSRLMPMYLLKQNADLAEKQLKEGENLQGFITSGISRLFSMQTDNGGLGAWPGATVAYDYGSVYALHFLTLVKNGRDFELPEKQFEALQDYVRTVARDWSQSDKSALYKRAYAVYVLALGGDNEALQQIQRFDAVKVPSAARYLLAAALATNGQDADRVKMYLQNAPSEPHVVTEQSNTLNSDIRNTAVELLALQQMKGDPAEMAEKAERLTAFLNDRRYGTTQETAFICASLVSYLEGLGQNIEAAAAKIEGGKGGEVKGRQIHRSFHQGPGGAFTVTNTGKALVFVSATTRGVPAQPDTQPLAENIKVSRALYDESGSTHSGDTFEQAESYVVGIELVSDRPVENLVVADLIPAGFEIQNPRLEADAIPSGSLNDGVTPTYLEVRDDRLVAAFDQLGSGTHKFFYLVRAVTPGQYQYPAVTAECMYDASVRGRGEPATVMVSGK